MNPLPQHIAIIMDGNGRWAQQKGLPRVAGHRKGVDVVDSIVTTANDSGIPFLTLYAFSEENWMRPDEEVLELMSLLGEFLLQKREKMIRMGVRFRTIGDVQRLPEGVQSIIQDTIDATAQGTGVTLILALSYGSRAEICRAIQRAQAAGVQEVTPEVISSYLDTTDYPDPDLLIRTSGEYRISNFLLWQLAYTELFFVPTLWPDFSPEHFEEALAAYQMRERRFGRVHAA